MAGCREISLGFTDAPASEGLHICYIYGDEKERQEVIAGFLAGGLRGNEKVLCLADAPGRAAILDRLAALGVSDAALTLADSAAGYCPSGRFVPDVTLDLVRDFYDHAVGKEGYAGARGTGQMSWAADRMLADPADLIRYEARVNQVLEKHPYTACCQYDARLFGGQMLMDVLSIHPMMIIRGQIVRNPFYIEPEAFLREFENRQ